MVQISIATANSPYTDEFTNEEIKIIQKMAPLPQLTLVNKINKNPLAIRFGRLLFFSIEISPKKISCASCHDPKLGYADGKKLGKGPNGLLKRHTPTIINAAFQRWFFWDGRADSLWSQAIQPLESENEMASSRLYLAHSIWNSKELKSAYEDVFGFLPKELNDIARFPAHGAPRLEGINARHRWLMMDKNDQDIINNILVNSMKAIAAFESTILSTKSPFDIFSLGIRPLDPEAFYAMDKKSRKGLKLFLGKAKCILCHHGALFSDFEFHNLGLAINESSGVDVGRIEGTRLLKLNPFNITSQYSYDIYDEKNFTRQIYSDRNQIGQFKTPSLRELKKTAPYFHDGRFSTVREVIDFYSRLEDNIFIGQRELFLEKIKLSKSESEALEEFLLEGLNSEVK